MARMNRITGGSDDLDEYLRAEYRAEEGAYLERRPDYAGRGSTDRNRRFWEPRVPTEYGVEESFTGAGTAFPRDEPLRRDESGFERGFSDTRTSGDVRREGRPGYGRVGDGRSGRDPRDQDRRAGRQLAHAAESFYEDLAGAIGFGTEHRRDLGHRGRGPRNYRRSDERILEEVVHRLTDDAHVDASDIEVSVKDREVTLSGTVATRFEKRRAEDIAEAVSGVTHVQNNLRMGSVAGAYPQR